MKVVVTYEPAVTHLAELRRAAPAAEIAVPRGLDEARAAAADADAILGNRHLVESLPFTRRLRWAQSNSMGVDRILASGALPSSAVLTAVRGVYEHDVAEHAIALLLSLARGLHTARDRQRGANWERHPLRSLDGMRAVVLGWGGVGRAAGALLAAFGARVEGVRRRHEGAAVRDERGFLVHGERWRESVAGADVLLVALPLTAATRRMVGATELASLAKGAFVVSVGRGGTLDEGALLAAIRAGRIAGAGLDVFEEEPLPARSPLWADPRVIVSPHSARCAETPPFRWESLFVENLRRFAAGEPLLHVVDAEAGY